MLHLKSLFLSGDRTTIVLSSTLGITEMEKPWKADVSSVSPWSERHDMIMGLLKKLLKDIIMVFAL